MCMVIEVPFGPDTPINGCIQMLKNGCLWMRD